MREWVFAGVAVATFAAGPASAKPTPYQADRGLTYDVNVEPPTRYVYSGRRHCWYVDGWNGPGWYRCGYHIRDGQGWGGGAGWNGWRVN
jgi:hypothetical protein